MLPARLTPIPPPFPFPEQWSSVRFSQLASGKQTWLVPWLPDGYWSQNAVIFGAIGLPHTCANDDRANHHAQHNYAPRAHSLNTCSININCTPSGDGVVNRALEASHITAEKTKVGSDGAYGGREGEVIGQGGNEEGDKGRKEYVDVEANYEYGLEMDPEWAARFSRTIKRMKQKAHKARRRASWKSSGAKG